ncbi:HNH endonuclease signature motif containing protein [Tessaracoccus caeni]|uniref:HNH endonuclease signature motif containing protein n=1 Tax=Tessaracoccus caeni TaxID=3031239 RepID=UPI0023DCA715|nr:HNH endonuclease signature motif containing protein [Tessaracoccus caeni]MDF1488022.1 DUF222 domain-containing protein [Tessaracoccus caeni]
METTTRTTTGEALEAITGWLAVINPTEWDVLPEPELLELLWQARKIADRVTGLAAMLTATTERRNAAILVTRTPLNTLIAQTEHRDGKDANRAIFQGRDLARNPAVSKAVLDGTISTEHARGVVKAMKELPSDLTRAQAEKITGLLVEEATHTVPSELPTRAKEALRRVAPELVPSPADEDKILAEQRRIALRRRSFTYGDDNEGSIWFRGSLPHLEAEPLLNTLHQVVAAGKRAERDKPSNSVGREVTREQRYADALTQLAEEPQTGRRARPRATVIVTIKETDLYAKAHAAGVLASGRKIPAGELRRLLCDANIIPVVLGGDSEILDVGTTYRFVTPAIRRALSVRDGTCVFPSCTVPDAECDAHHVIPWKHGGPTSLGNLVLLCGHHHGLVEPRDGDDPTTKWQIGFDPRTKKPVLTRPGMAKITLLPQPDILTGGSPTTAKPAPQPLLC